jgi:hypothetical protein
MITQQTNKHKTLPNVSIFTSADVIVSLFLF